MTVVAIHQPQNLPWLGYFHKLDRADVFCLLDTVQYKKNEFQNRNRIKTSQGWQWLTVPVTYRFPQRIHEVGVNQTVDWQRKHLMMPMRVSGHPRMNLRPNAPHSRTYRWRLSAIATSPWGPRHWCSASCWQGTRKLPAHSCD